MTKQYYAAPMEGLTTWLWRRVHHDIFGGADKYFTPFLSPNANCSFQVKELREIDRNAGLPVVPQILTAEPDHFLWAARELADRGYEQVNLNLGCPSGTVCAKHKGAGLLSWPGELQHCLEGIFSGLPAGMTVSVKTRIGRRSDEEWETLLPIFNRYPICELIVHPRVQKDFYKGAARRRVFDWTREHTDLPLIYNGDVKTPEDAAAWDVGVMAGRGLMADPALLRRSRGGPAATRRELADYLDALAEGYTAAVGPDAALHRLWELWAYLGDSFPEAEGLVKRIRKCRTLAECRSLGASAAAGERLAWE